MITLDELKLLKIKNYKLDKNMEYETETISFSKEDDEDNFITFTSTEVISPEGEVSDLKGLTIEFTERCTPVKVVYFTSSATLESVQSYFNKLIL